MQSLKNYCKRFIIDNFDELIDDSHCRPLPLYFWKNFPDDYTEGITDFDEILRALVKRKKLEKEHLVLFSSKFCHLNSRVYLSGMELDEKSVEFVFDKRMYEVDISYCTGIHLQDVVDCLSCYSRNTLETLNLKGIYFDMHSLRSLNIFSTLASLNLSRTNLDDKSLVVLVDTLNNIRHLDISRTCVQDIKCLGKWHKELIALDLGNLSLDVSLTETLSALQNLNALDISLCGTLGSDRRQDIETLLSTECLPELKEFDISGNSLQLTHEELR